MPKQRIHSNLGEFDTLTKDELGPVLDSTFERHLREKYRSIKLMKLPVVSVQAPVSGNLLLVNSGSTSAYCGPDSGFLWQVRRINITSSGGYVDTAGVPGVTSRGSAPGTVVSPGAGATITSGTLPATLIPVLWTIQWNVLNIAATGAPNNYQIVIGASSTPSLNPATAGVYAQQAIQYLQPAGGSVSVAIKSISADTGTYSGIWTANAISSLQLVGGGDTAIINYLYVGSDNSQNQNSIIGGAATTLGAPHYPGGLGLWVFPGEQIYASLSGVTAGNVYTLTGVAIEVAAEQIGKLLT